MSKRLVSFLLSFIMVIGSLTPVFANGIIINGGSEDTAISNEKKVNSNEDLKSSITINNGENTDKKEDEIPSSLVMDNNNTEEKDKLEVSEEKKPEAQKADDNVPPAEDFNEEITEFKQYVRNVTDGQPDGEFVEKLNFHQTPDKVNKIEHKFTLKTRPLSRDYKEGELKIDLTGIEKTREYLDSENNMVGCKITEYNIISNSSEFFSRKTSKKNNHGDNPLFAYCTELTNKTTLRKGETIDVSYIYQEYVNDFYLKNNSTVNVNTYLNKKLIKDSPLITYTSDIVNDSFYPHANAYNDYLNSYISTHLGEKYGFEGKNYRVINIGANNYESSQDLNRSRCFNLPFNSRATLLADFYSFEGGKSKINTTRTLMVNTPLNKIYPKLILNANKDLVYLRGDGTIEKYKAGADIVLAENGKIVRRLGGREDTIEKEEKNIGVLLVERDDNINTNIYVSFKLKNSYFKDEEVLIPEKEVQRTRVGVNKKLPPNQVPKITNVSAVINTGCYEECLSYKDLFSGVKTFFSPDSQSSSQFRIEYNNPTEIENDNNPKTIKILEVVYNKKNLLKIIFMKQSHSTDLAIMTIRLIAL